MFNEANKGGDVAREYGRHTLQDTKRSDLYENPIDPPDETTKDEREPDGTTKDEREKMGRLEGEKLAKAEELAKAFEDIPTQEEIDDAAAAYAAYVRDTPRYEADSDIDILENETSENPEEALGLDKAIVFEKEDEGKAARLKRETLERNQDYIDKYGNFVDKIRALMDPNSAEKIAKGLKERAKKKLRKAGEIALKQSGIDLNLADALTIPAGGLESREATQLLAILGQFGSEDNSSETKKEVTAQADNIGRRIKGLNLKKPKDTDLQNVFEETKAKLAGVDRDALATYLNDGLADNVIDQLIARKAFLFFDSQTRAAQNDESSSTDDEKNLDELTQVDTLFKLINENPEKIFEDPQGMAILEAVYHFGLELLNEEDRRKLQAKINMNNFDPLSQIPVPESKINPHDPKEVINKEIIEEALNNNQAYAYLQILNKLKDAMPLVVIQYFVNNLSIIQPLLFELKVEETVKPRAKNNNRVHSEHRPMEKTNGKKKERDAENP